MQKTDTSNNISAQLQFSPNVRPYSKLQITSSDRLLYFTSSETDHDASTSKSYSIFSNESDSNRADINDNVNSQDEEWMNSVGNQPNIKPFVGVPGLKSVKCNPNKKENFYLLLVPEEIFQEIANQTNLYATQVLSQKQSSYWKQWIPTNKNEIKRLFGLLIWMDLVKLPEVHLYWSKDKLYEQSFPQSIMSRNRFELLLQMLHFTNNENANLLNDRLYKIRPIIDTLNENFTKYYDPPEILYIDEFVIPLHGHIKQLKKKYRRQKRYKYSIKILKLCFNPGYTYNFQTYCNRRSDQESTNPTNAVISLCQNIFYKGHTICTDRWYTSIDLAQELITKSTHLIGMVQQNCRGISREVVTKKLKRGEMFAKENSIGLTLMKWKDRRNVLLLSTKHSVETVTNRKRKSNCIRPKILLDYNIGKPLIDVSDQMMICSSHKSIKWYKKLAFELLLNTAVTNAWVMHNSIKNNSISLVEFKKRLVIYLSHCQDTVSQNLPREIMMITKKRNEIKKREGKLILARQRCISCYKENIKNFGSELARNKTKRVATFCADCPNEPNFCLACFNKEHRDIPF
ncbi:hypothetical protein K0M31_020472 [Melipona bicolor]|uniref:PiggyBac transposable element-derived protein domain-containing protein n=1 Tax=Melipona bicolor TaxID=60889 RepID=A0AA40KM95_9HYME|nr:hypothetical protein K0M31_020472 [Melipona bicolor]